MMREVSEEEQIDFILGEIAKYGSVTDNSIFASYKIKIDKLIFGKMGAEDLIRVGNVSPFTGTTYFLTDNGRKVLADGGYAKYLQRIEREKKIAAQREKSEVDRVKRLDEKLDLDIQKLQGDISRSNEQTILIQGQIEKLQNDNRYFYVPYVISSLALIISAATFFLKACEKKSTEKTQSQPPNLELKIESTQTKIPSLYPSLRVDSASLKK